MAVSSVQIIKLETIETISTGLDPGGEFDSVTLVHNVHAASADEEQILNASSTPAATKVWADRIKLSSGEADLDLTALAGPFNTSVDFTGLRVRMAHLQAASTNTDTVGISPSETNGYNLFGSGTVPVFRTDTEGFVHLDASDEITIRYKGTLAPVVAANVKGLHLFSDDDDAYLDLHLVAG